jgi:thiol-disulfide isomerase/thioredoxin
METKYIIGFVAAVAIILGGIGFLNYKSQAAQGGQDLIPFAQCLKEKKVTFFGAFWCPHCQATKRMFGAAVKSLPYVECSIADGKGQTQVCKDNKIESYPTWQFADGSRLSGEQTLQALADKSTCSLPAGRAGVTTPVNTGSSTTVTQ